MGGGSVGKQGGSRMEEIIEEVGREAGQEK